jgi:uncharacterized protein
VRRERGIDYHVVVEALRGDSIEERSHRLFRERRAGEETDGRGLVLLVDPIAEQVRVEVGYALEGDVTDLEASRLLAEYLAPYFRSDDSAAGIEASIEAVIDILGPPAAHSAVADTISSSQSEVQQSPLAAADAPIDGSGGAGASLELLREIPDGALDRAAEAALRTIMVPQREPRQSRDLEIALMHKGIYYADTPLYDEAWRAARQPKSWDPDRLREIARQWDRPYRIEIREPRAVAYYEDAPELGPTFLRRDSTGWIIDASEAAKTIVYDYSSSSWYALDSGSPYLEILEAVLPLRRVTLSDDRAAWQIDNGR